MLTALQRRLVYFPDASPVPAAGDVRPGARDVTLRTSDGLELGAWFVPASPTADRRRAVLVAPGNGGNRSGRLGLAAELSRRGFAVLLMDYRGYGGNPGSPSEQGLALDVRAAHRFLVAEAGVPSDRIVFYGESLGAAVVAELAVEHPPAALVLRSPFVDLAAVGQRHYPFLPVRALLRDRFPTAEHVARVAAPITVIWGSADAMVPAEQSRAVAAAGHARTVEVDGADHNDGVLLDGDQLVTAVVERAAI
jgi:uncharacterized protein